MLKWNGAKSATTATTANADGDGDAGAGDDITASYIAQSVQRAQCFKQMEAS